MLAAQLISLEPKMASAKAVTNVSTLFLGKCLPSLRHNSAKFEIPYYYFDSYLKMYFKKSFVLFAFDTQKLCKSGDIALIQELPNKISNSIRHKVVEIVYHYGDVTDPVTGKKVVNTRYRDEIQAINSLYGKINSSFDYNAAPPRGWQEGKKDFTHRESYFKYNEFSKGDENENQPCSSTF